MVNTIYTNTQQSLSSKHHNSTKAKQHENQQHTVHTVIEHKGPLRGRVPLAAICTSRWVCRGKGQALLFLLKLVSCRCHRILQQKVRKW